MHTHYKCPECKTNLVAVPYNEDPILIEKFACFGCGKTYAPDKIKKIYKRGNVLNYDFHIRNVLNRNSDIKELDLAFYVVEEEYRKQGIRLTQKQKQRLRKKLKKYLLK